MWRLSFCCCVFWGLGLVFFVVFLLWFFGFLFGLGFVLCFLKVMTRSEDNFFTTLRDPHTEDTADFS